MRSVSNPTSNFSHSRSALSRRVSHQVPHKGAWRAAGLASLVSAIAFTTTGCNRKSEAPAVAKPKPTAPARIGDADLKKYKPNEAGAVMVLMYHRLNPKEPDNDLNRRPETFRKDLETLYARGYRPVTATEFVENRMDVPIGKTPVVLTFDDALPTQFRLKIGANGDTVIDRESAVGIMEKFHEEHPDWATKATFFVLPEGGRNSSPFGQSEGVGEKFSFLLKKGYEIANHSATHANMRGMNAAKVQEELATAVRGIKNVAPDATMQTLALPYGKLPRADAARQALLSGSSGGTSYKNKAVFLAAWRPVLSPITRNDSKLATQSYCAFNPARLERITPNARAAKQPGTMEYWLKHFQANPGERYISDGQMQIVAVPVSEQASIDEAKIRAQGRILQAYGGVSSAGANSGSGGDLKVE